MTGKNSEDRQKGESQVDKFKQAARELDVDEDEAAFKRKLARLAKAVTPDKKESSKKSKHN